MRPYQIAATERMLWKIKSSYEAKKWSTTEGGGYIWHTTGSGKTLTSFKAARLATQLAFIDKVFFVVDRKDLVFQTMKEYQRFSPDSVNGSDSTAGLKRNIEKKDNKINFYLQDGILEVPLFIENSIRYRNLKGESFVMHSENWIHSIDDAFHLQFQHILNQDGAILEASRLINTTAALECLLEEANS